ncbi:MAG: methyltransferase domain-containing protein [Bacteroidetes bacterium]|nr:methyltransferase domain-containing protein [Bacteroidota bacterium]MBS1975138.1 methyltransferase domain-containing protein [Bacteroidota bacterium]
MSKEAYQFGGDDAANYEHYLGPLIFEPSAKEFLPCLQALPAKSILETSSGTGRLTTHLRHGFSAGTSLTSTDISSDMLMLAREKLKGQQVEFKIANGQQLPFADSSFELVVNQYGLMFFPDRQKGFDEAYRVLKPGGHFAFATWDRIADMPLFKIPLMDHIIPFFKGEDTSRFHLPFSLHDPRELLGFLKNAGFKHNKIMFIEFSGTTDDVMNIVNGMFLKHPLSRAVHDKDPARVSPIAVEIERSLTAFFGKAPFEFSLKAWIGIGQK